ncbi:zinc finger protein 585A-like isoform X2 [Homarus americanus]|uniref:zinc finger protein 585A-like isoform X2 n=1 Tax=Homarus americanus TaxID=6706 RepID=UPI001C43E7A9|nr:zinc finger protein 585A-like isoform X2 [Homarus americanus]
MLSYITNNNSAYAIQKYNFFQGFSMGAIHGKGRFKCSGCHRSFSWRLDLAEHVNQCRSVQQRKCKDQQAEYYLLGSCFLCGCHLSGVQSEEASFIKGLQKLYHSKRSLIEVLEVITQDSTLVSLAQHTIGLCKDCMNAVNRWDEMEQQLLTIAKSLRNSYRLKHRKDGTKLLEKRVILVSKEQRDICNEAVNDAEDDEDEELPEDHESENQEGIVKQEKTDMTNQHEKFQDCDKKEYTCDCGKTVRGLDVFVEHQLRAGCRIKTNEYPCKYCGSVFAEKKLLIVHKKACIEGSLINGAHECDICGRRFLVRGRVETHKRNVHSIGTADQQLCSFCGRTFGSSYNMKNHLAREHGIGQIEVVVCELCGGKFSDRSSLRNHMKNIHGERKYECETCGKKFATPGMRNHHINEMHNNTYNYECNLCGEQFHVSFKYRYHMRKMHNTLQYACDDCGRTFIMRSDLYRHVRGVHMGIRDPKRYPCKVCGRLFPSKYKVKRHMSSHGYLASKVDKNILEQQVTDAESANIPQEQSESGISSRLTEATTNNNDRTSIDVHQLPVSEIYSGPHITTLTPEILQSGVGPDMVATETMVVGSMSSIVVSASSIPDSITAELHHAHQDAHHHQLNQNQEQHHHEQTPDHDQQFCQGNSLMQQTLTSSIIPVQQMIVIQDSVTVPGHTEFSVPPPTSQVISVPQPTSQVISVPPVSGQVISVAQSNSQVISVPTVSSQVISGTLHTPQATFAVPMPQHTSQINNQQKLPAIHYQYFPS